MIKPEFPKATKVVANTSTETDVVELTPIDDPIGVVATKVVIDSISVESDKLEIEGE